MKMRLALSVILATILVMVNTVIAAPSKIYSEDKLNIHLSSTDSEFVIKLKSNPSTGYTWALRQYDTKLLTLINHHYEAAKTKLIGAPGYELWTFQINTRTLASAKHSNIYFSYARQWEKVKNGREVVFSVSLARPG